MNLHDTLTELWRLAERGSIHEETRLETAALDFQDLLHEHNQAIGESARNEFIGPPEFSALHPESSDEKEKWTPFTNTEIDAIRHYYGQKMALENENAMVGLAVPFAHEVMGNTGLISPHWKESLYDLYINAIATKDHYLDKGLPGAPFHQMLQGDMPEREFRFWGEDALRRVPAYDEE